MVEPASSILSPQRLDHEAQSSSLASFRFVASYEFSEAW